MIEGYLIKKYSRGFHNIDNFHKILMIAINTFALLLKYGGVEQKTISSIESIPENDGATYKLLGSGALPHAVELLSEGLMDVLESTQPACYDDLVAVVALYRPSSMMTGLLDKYVENKNRADINSINRKLRPILNRSFGLIIYKQQLNYILENIACFSKMEIQRFSKNLYNDSIPSLSDRKSELEGFRKKFCNGCVQRGMDTGDANALFDQIKEYSTCYFDRDAARNVTFFRYRMAWFKVHYPLLLRAGALTAAYGSSDRIQNEVWNCREENITVLLPDIVFSHVKSVPESDRKIRMGFLAVLGVTEKISAHIIEIRHILKNMENKEHRTVNPLLFIKRFLFAINFQIVPQDVLANLIQAGAFRKITKDIDFSDLNQDDIHDRNVSKAINCLEAYQTWEQKERLTAEFVVLGCSLSAHPLATINFPYSLHENLSYFDLDAKKEKHEVFVRVVSVKLHLTLEHLREYADIVVDDLYTRRSVYVPSDVYVRLKSMLKPSNMLSIDVRVTSFPSGAETMSMTLLDAKFLPPL